MKTFKSVGLLISSSIIVSGFTIICPSSSEAIVINSNLTNQENTLINLNKLDFSSYQITDIKPMSSSIADFNVGSYFVGGTFSNGVNGAQSIYKSYQKGTLIEDIIKGGIFTGVAFGVFWFVGSLLEKRR
ncbi:hypothetical protein H6G64_35390 [Calothrix sp. FACHB-156]|nr:hypothetical protein [Calothrix sp. FACHB-156]